MPINPDDLRGNPVRDCRQGKWFWTDKDVFDKYAPLIGAYAYAVYVALCRYADNQTQACWPSRATIAKQLGISIPTVKRSLTELKKHRLISIESGGGEFPNTYTLLQIPEPGSIGTGVCNSELGSKTAGEPGSIGTPNKTYREQDSNNKTHSCESGKDDGFKLSSPEGVASKKEKKADDRQKPFTDAIFTYWKSAFPDDPITFGPADGKILKDFLRDNPEITLDKFKFYLGNRLKSDNIRPLRPASWIGNITQFAAPLNQKGLPKFSEPRASDDREWMTPERLKAMRGF